MELTVAITGASGTIYAHRTLQLLAASGTVETINLIMSGTAATVAQVEMGVNLKEPDAAKINEWLGLPADSKLIRFWRLDNFAAKAFVGLEQTGRDDHRAVLDGHDGGDRIRCGHKSDPSRGGRLPQRGPQTCACAA